MIGSDFAPDLPEFYLEDPDASFRRLRAEDPVHWYAPGGFWCITRHADVQYVSRTPRLFCSRHGTQIFEIQQVREGRRKGVEGAAPSIIQMDPPQHNRFRKLVIRAFTARTVSALEPRIREIARESLSAIEPGECLDFVEKVAIPLPMLVIAEMLGVPSEDREDFRRWSDAMIEAGGGGTEETTVRTVSEMFAYFQERIPERQREPRSDLLSALVHAEIDGERLSEPEILIFCLTLLVAGNETTRNLISGGARALMENPDEKRKLVEDPRRIPNAVEEMLRWVTPVRNFARRATHDTELGGAKIAEGDFVVLLYGSANRDEAVFGEDSHRFDVTRERAPRHLAFGFGEHLCMGASLARLETRVMFQELLARFPRLKLAGPVTPLRSILINGIERMPVVFEP
ncbi:MAG: cytochrome P450 [Myxococcota bacterium]